jgi:hypothetical protein
MKKIFLTLISIFIFSAVVFSQSNDWEMYSENNGVLIYSKTSDCHMPSQGLHQEMMLLKLVNTTNQNMQIDFDVEYWAMEECMNCESITEDHRSITLNAGESIEGECSQMMNSQGLVLFVSFLNFETRPPIMSRFEIANLKINIK